MVDWFSAVAFLQFVQMFSSFIVGAHSEMLDGGYDYLQLNGSCLQSHKCTLGYMSTSAGGIFMLSWYNTQVGGVIVLVLGTECVLWSLAFVVDVISCTITLESAILWRSEFYKNITKSIFSTELEQNNITFIKFEILTEIHYLTD